MPVISNYLAPGVIAGESEMGGSSSPGASYNPAVANNASQRGFQDGALLPSGATARRPNSREFQNNVPETNRQQFDNMPIAEPQRSYDFRVILPSIPGAVTPIAEATDAVVLEGTQAVSEPIGGRYRRFPGLYDTAPLPVVLYHNQESEGVPGHVALDYLRAWIALIQNQDGTYNYPKNYWKDIYLEFRNVNQQRGYLIKYKDSWPVAFQPIRMQFAQSARTVILTTFACNRIIPRPDLGGTITGTVNQAAPNPGQPSDSLWFTNRGISVLNV